MGGGARASGDGKGNAERCDAIVVGARCAGSAAAIALARAGRQVVALDSSRFPSDTLSTHLLWAGGVAELKRLGALERVEALGAPHLPEALAGWNGHEIRGRYSPVDGIDYGMCVRRPGLDAALVETARDAGAEVREKARVIGLLREDGPAGESQASRICGVRWRDEDGAEHELHAPLVVGADGKRSLVAREVGADEAVIERESGRGCYFAYWRDTEGHARDGWRSIAAQWRHGEELVTAFPCDDDLILVLLMPPVERAAALRADLEAGYDAIVATVPELAARLEGCTRETKVRHTPQTVSYFRRATGPGWALAGDAGHFKDPVTAQGIRDAIRFGRLLGEAAAPHLSPAPGQGLDRALRDWEMRRDRECISTYHWTNRLGRAEPMNPIEAELYALGHGNAELAGEFLDVFSRVRKPRELLPARRVAQLTARALRREDADRAEVLRTLRRELRASASEAGQSLRLRLGRRSSSRRRRQTPALEPGRPRLGEG